MYSLHGAAFKPLISELGSLHTNEPGIWNSKVKPEPSSPQPQEWLWHAQDVVQTGPCCFTLPGTIPVLQQHWECCPRRLDGGRAKLTEMPGTGDTPQGCLPQQQDQFALRKMLLTKHLLAACSASGWFTDLPKTLLSGDKSFR